jgi:CRP/FNR family transcriptional regulator, anaerobic regulatory protein
MVWGNAMDEVFQSGVSDALDRSVNLDEQADALSSDYDEIGLEVPVRTLSIGEILFREGEPKTHLQQIVAGVVCVYRSRTGQSDEIIEFVFPGDVLALGYLEHHIYWARALVKTHVRSLPLTSLSNVVQYDHRAKQRHAEALDREFAYRRDLLTAGNRHRPIGRVAAFLVAVSQFSKDEGRDPNMITDSFKCGVVAKWLGLDVDTLRRALVELEKRRLIQSHASRGLRLIDLKGLEALAVGGATALR